MNSAERLCPRLPSQNREDTEDISFASIDLENNNCPSNFRQEDIEAAQTLLKLRRDSTFAIRRLVNRHNGTLGRAVTKLIQQSILHPLHTVKSAEEFDRDQRIRLRKNELSAALSLVKLSGRSRADSKAGLTLLCLRRECMIILAQTRQKRTPPAQLAIEKRNVVERFLALKKFHNQYPAVLRTSRRKDGVLI